MKCDKCGVDSDAHQEAKKQYEANCLVPIDEEKIYTEITNKSRPPYLDWDRVISRRISEKYGQPAKKSPSTNKIMDILNELCGEPRAQKLKIARAIKQLIDEKE